MKISITRRFEFDAAHRVLGHEGKCKHLHGHRYCAEVTVVPAGLLDDLGRVIDYSVLKELIGGWIDQNWDHNILLNSEDPLAILASHGETLTSHVGQVRARDIFQGRHPYIMEKKNPTAEYIAAELFKVCFRRLPSAIEPKRVRIYETPSCWADFPGEKDETDQ